MKSRFVAVILLLSVLLNRGLLQVEAYHTNYLYSYDSTAGILGSEAELSTSAHILATSYEIGSASEKSALPGFRKILLHINLLDSSSEIVQALAIRGSDGAIDRFLVAEDVKNDLNLLNKIKGFLTILTVNPLLLPSREVDIHGKCLTSYALGNISAGDESMVIDKVKRDCEPLHKHVGEYDKSLAVGSLVTFDEQIHTRYWIEKEKGTLIRAEVNSTLTIKNPFSTLVKQPDQILLRGSEHLKMRQLVRQDDVATFIKFNRTIIELKPASLTDTAKSVFGDRFAMMHLSPMYQSETLQEACSLMDHLYKSEVHFRLPEIQVKNMIMKFSGQLRSDGFGSIGYEKAALEFVKIMRCFPHTESTKNFFVNTLELSHSNLLENSYFLKSWKASLIDVFINCGTELCLDLLTNLLETLSSLLMQNAPSPASSPLKQYFKTQVWINLGFVRKPSLHFINKLDEICTKLEKLKDLQTDWYSCFNVLSLMHQKNPDFMPKIEAKLLELLKRPKQKSEPNYNERILFTFLAISKRPPKNADILKTIFDDFAMKKGISLSLRAAALNSLIKTKNLTYSAKLVDSILEGNLPEPLSAFAFSLLIGEDELLSAPLLLYIFQQLVQQKRFNVIASGRRALKMACHKERVEMCKCNCIESGGWIDELGFQCKPGLAASWSGLAFGNASLTVNHGVFENQTELLSDYASMSLSDNDGNLLYSINQANLVTQQGETKLGELNLVFDTQQSWMMMVFEILGMRTIPVSLPVSAMDGLAWIMTESERKTRAKFDRLAIDSRTYLTFASQWPITVDLKALVGLEFDSSFEIVSIWSQKGTLNINSKVAILFDGELRIKDSILNFGVSAETGLSYSVTSEPEKISNGIACSSLKTSKQSLAKTWIDPTLKRASNFLEKLNAASNKSEFNRDSLDFNYQSTDIPLGPKNEEMCAILNNSWS